MCTSDFDWHKMKTRVIALPDWVLYLMGRISGWHPETEGKSVVKRHHVSTVKGRFFLLTATLCIVRSSLQQEFVIRLAFLLIINMIITVCTFLLSLFILSSLIVNDCISLLVL